VWCWGYGPNGEIGNGTTSNSKVPVQVPNLQAAHLTSGLGFICAITMTGEVSCWGQGDQGQIGDGHFNDHGSPSTVAGISGATSIASGGDQTCVLAASGQMCWGGDQYGELADGTTDWLAVRGVQLPCP